MKRLRNTLSITTLLAGALTLVPTVPAAADQVINDDCIVIGSQCIGVDCVNGESFGFDTLRLKENNLRIKFDDTSNSASFPRNDWQLTANDSANGGAERFSIDDITGGRTPFTIRGGAPSNSLYVDAGGRVGFKTSTPVVELHVRDGDTPTLRLEQDGSSGFTPQTWDLAGNETNFFIRDVTGGSRLVFKLKPGAPNNSLFVAADGKVGMGTDAPAGALHIKRNEKADFAYENTMATGNKTWTVSNANNGVFAIDSIPTSGANPTEFRLQQSGNLLISGALTTATTTYPDYVFEPDYELMPLDELKAFIEREKHLPNVLSSSDVEGGKRVNMSQLQVQLLEKVEELTLYTLEQKARIDELENANRQLAELHERLARLEASVDD